MNRLIAAAAVLLLGTTARADMGLPFARYVPVRITLHVDPPPPGIVLFVQDAGSQRRMTSDSPIVITSPPGRHGAGFEVFAVPEAVVAAWPEGKIPHRGWFGPPDRAECKCIGGGGMAGGRVSFDDDRKVVEKEYRVVRDGDWVRLILVSENEGSRGYKVALGLVCCFGVPAATLGLWSWLIGRLFRRVK